VKKQVSMSAAQDDRRTGGEAQSDVLFDPASWRRYCDALMDRGHCEGSRWFAGGHRRKVVAIFVAVAALLCAVRVGSADAASSVDNRVVTVGYQGSYDGTISYDEADLGTVVSHVTWDLAWTGTLQQLLAAVLKTFTVKTLTGTETVSQHGTTCTVSFSPNPSTGPQTPVGRLLNAYRDSADPSKVVIGVQAPVGIRDLISNDPACGGNGADGAGGPEEQQLFTPRLLFDLDISGAESQPVEGSWSASDTISTSTSKVDSTVTFSGGCDSPLADVASPAVTARAAGKRGEGGTMPKVCKRRKPHPQPKLPQKPASNPLTSKQWQWLGGVGLHQIREDQAKLLAAAGAGELASKLLIAATPLAQYELYVMAATLGAHATELIKLEVEYDDLFNLFQKDPPDTATSDVALPSASTSPPDAACLSVRGRYARRATAACKAAKPLFDAVAADTAKTNALLDAALTTANRYATALRGGQTAASGLQQTTEAILNRRVGCLAHNRAPRPAAAQRMRAQTGSIYIVYAQTATHPRA
jgi:hypothetical protein